MKTEIVMAHMEVTGEAEVDILIMVMGASIKVLLITRIWEGQPTQCGIKEIFLMPEISLSMGNISPS